MRLAARRRQRAVSERTAGSRHPLPGPVSSLRRGTIPITAGLLLIAVAGFAVVQARVGISADQHRSDGATRTSARVLSRGEESVRVRTEDGRRLTLSASYPEDYRMGATVTVLEDGTWRRLAAEPYDAFAWQLLVLATGLPGGSILVTGLLARRRAAALRRVPLPVMRVRERSDDTGRIWLYAGDDDTARAPLFSSRFTGHRLGTKEPEAAYDADEDEPFTIDTRIGGCPCPRGSCGMAGAVGRRADGDGRRSLRTRGPGLRLGSGRGRGGSGAVPVSSADSAGLLRGRGSLMGPTVCHNHPGEPIEDYLRRGGLLSRFSAAAALPQQMQSAYATRGPCLNARLSGCPQKNVD